MGRVLRGWGLAARGDCDAGIEEISGGLSSSRATGAHMDDPLYVGLLADAYLRAGELQAAGEAVDEALEIATRERSLFYEPELRRLAAEMRLAGRDAGSQAEAEASLNLALERARGQGSRALELRVADVPWAAEAKPGSRGRGPRRSWRPSTRGSQRASTRMTCARRPRC